MIAAAKERDLTRDHALALYGDMLFCRRLEEKCGELYAQGKIRGFLHLYIGEEAVAAGAFQALGAEDPVVSTYREHAHALLRGVPAGAIMAEMFGKREGCSGGRGGSMHLFDRARRFYGGNAIVGGGLPLAVGLALADRMQGRDAITACFLGDGAVAEGEFHESLNLAALWRLPVLFICENNLYPMGTAIERAQAEPNLYVKAQSYRIPSERVDGMDVLAMEHASRRAAAFVRDTSTPFFLEAKTYRFRAHSAYDPELYRSKAEVAQWKERDPLATFPAQLRARSLAGDEDFAAAEQRVAEAIDAAIRFAEAGTLEPADELLRHVYGTVQEVR